MWEWRQGHVWGIEDCDELELGLALCHPNEWRGRSRDGRSVDGRSWKTTEAGLSVRGTPSYPSSSLNPFAFST